jgi:RluA family pseudouridine synthase
LVFGLKKQWRVARKDAGMRLLQFLKKNCPKAPSVKALKRAIENKLCTVNKRIETFSSYVLKENDLITLNAEALAEPKQTKPLALPILYEDEELLIINKPAGLICDQRQVCAYFPQFKALALVHRLDKETSGVLILAKHSRAKDQMIALFKERAVRKIYVAVVDGIVEQEEGTVDNYLGRKHHYQGQTIYGAVSKKDGQHAVTHWKCLKRGKRASLLVCEPYTGRTHQLRVHLSGLGHPILGDTQYSKRFQCTFIPQRNLLHAYRVAFKHPHTKEEVKVVAPIPLDIKEALKELMPSLENNSLGV